MKNRENLRLLRIRDEYVSILTSILKTIKPHRRILDKEFGRVYREDVKFEISDMKKQKPKTEFDFADLYSDIWYGADDLDCDEHIKFMKSVGIRTKRLENLSAKLNLIRSKLYGDY